MCNVSENFILQGNNVSENFILQGNMEMLRGRRKYKGIYGMQGDLIQENH